VTPEKRYQLNAFREACLARLEQGCEEYGDRSFNAEPDVLLGEIQQELEDVANWSFIMWVRIQALRDAVADASWSLPHDREGVDG
jgi:hypothetical protein